MSLPILLGLLALSPVYAKDVLETIEVKEDKDVEFFTASDSTTIGRRRIETNSLGLTSTLLNDESSLIPSENGGPGSRISYFIRGTEARHLSFTLDGLKMNDVSNVDRQFDAATLMAGMFESMTIHKGPQAVLYGSDAMGGLIEIKTRKGSENPETKLTVNGGSFGTVEGTLSSDWGKNKNKGTVTLSQFHTDGISRLNKKRHNAKERDGSDVTQVSSSSEHQWASKFRTDLLLTYNHGKSELDGYSDDNHHDKTKNDQYIAQQKTYYQLAPNQTLSLRNGFNRHQRNVDTLSLGKEFYNGNLLQHELLHRVDWENFALLSGLSTEHEEMHSNSVEKSFDLSSLFIQGAMSFNGFTFHAGGRAEEHSRYGNFVTGSSGVTYKFLTQKIFAQYSQGFKAPSLYQLYEPATMWGGIGNPDLEPERNHSIQVGWELRNDKVTLGTTFFQNRLSNLITFASTGYVNEDRLVTEGVELKGNYKFHNFQIYGNFTHQKFKDFETPVLRRPYNVGMAGISYFPHETVEIYGKGYFSSSRKDYGSSGITRLNGYETYDLGAKKTWEKDEIGLEVKNIFDREYEMIYGYSTLPLSIFAHYAHTF